MKEWSKSWNSSTQPRKQRKFRYNAPEHLKGRFLNSSLSKELRQKHGTRSVRVRKGDRVKVVRGSFKGQSGKVENVDAKQNRVYLSKIEVIKKDGTKRSVPIHPSNCIIQELNLEDKRRLKRVPKTQSPKQGKQEKTGQQGKPAQQPSQKKTEQS